MPSLPMVVSTGVSLSDVFDGATPVGRFWRSIGARSFAQAPHRSSLAPILAFVDRRFPRRRRSSAGSRSSRSRRVWGRDAGPPPGGHRRRRQTSAPMSADRDRHGARLSNFGRSRALARFCRFLAGRRSVADRGGLLADVNRSKSLSMNKGKDFWAPRRHGLRRRRTDALSAEAAPLAPPWQARQPIRRVEWRRGFNPPRRVSRRLKQR